MWTEISSYDAFWGCCGGLAGREHVPASAHAASQPLHETDDRRARSDRPAQQRRVGQHPDVSATQALDGKRRLSTQRPLGHTFKIRRS
jgi:hypothetical protein